MANLKGMLAVGGLLAVLGSGCDKDETKMLGKCEVDISAVRVMYHEKKMNDDTYDIQFVRSDGTISKLEFVWYGDIFRGGAFPCKDGTTMVIDNDGNVYFKTGGQ